MASATVILREGVEQALAIAFSAGTWLTERAIEHCEAVAGFDPPDLAQDVEGFDLPVEQSTKVELVINFKTAKGRVSRDRLFCGSPVSRVLGQVVLIYLAIAGSAAQDAQPAAICCTIVTPSIPSPSGRSLRQVRSNRSCCLPAVRT
jgi:hypothetical protein